MERIAVFPGSFDPITKGHEAIVRRAIPLFDRIIVAIGINAGKKYMHDPNQRKAWLEATFADATSVKVAIYEGLTVNFCEEHRARFIIRGLRNGTDFEYEKTIAQMNQAIRPGIETVFFFTDPAFAAINSSVVRELISYGENVEAFVPEKVKIY